MKKLLLLSAAFVTLAAGAASANDFSLGINIGNPAPVYEAPAPVYVAPTPIIVQRPAYYDPHHENRDWRYWHDRHERERMERYHHDHDHDHDHY